MLTREIIVDDKMENIIANKLRTEIIEDCKIKENHIRIGLSKRHTGYSTVIIKKELFENKCVKSKIKELKTYDSEDKNFLIIDE